MTGVTLREIYCIVTTHGDGWRHTQKQEAILSYSTFGQILLLRLQYCMAASIFCTPNPVHPTLGTDPSKWQCDT